MLGADALADKNLFVQGSFSDLGIDGSDKDAPAGTNPPKLLSCDTVEERKILNNTCVLSPIVTQGERAFSPADRPGGPLATQAHLHCVYGTLLSYLWPSNSPKHG